MRKFTLTALAGLFVFTLASSALAADLPRKAPSYSPSYVGPFSWSGFYVGINGGYGFGTSSWTSTGGALSTGNFNVKGPLVGGTVGYNLQTGVWVWGVEGDLDASWMKGSTNTNCATPCTTKNQYLGTARGRIGYAWDRWLPYITGGAAFGDIKTDPAPGFTSIDKFKVGWTAGLGVEYAFMGAWSAKLEYLYADLGKASCDAASCGTAADVSLKANIVRAGLNYRF